MSSKIVVLKSSDGDTFEVDAKVALQSHMIQQSFEHRFEDDECTDTLVVPLPDVSSVILSKVIEYCKKHVELSKHDDKLTEVELESFDAEFVKVDEDTLFRLLLAADYLDIKGLLDLTCQTVGHMIKDLSPKEVREMFHIRDYFTPEEEEAIRRENPWDFE